MTKYYRDASSGVSASITERRDGTAVLRTSIKIDGRKTRNYKNFKSAYTAWYRMTN